jgi:hypothetical protein
LLRRPIHDTDHSPVRLAIQEKDQFILPESSARVYGLSRLQQLPALGSLGYGYLRRIRR